VLCASILKFLSQKPEVTRRSLIFLSLLNYCIDNCCIYNYIIRMSKTSHPSDLEDHLGYWLRCLSNFVSGSFEKKLSGHNISVAQWVVLRTLYESSGVTLNQAAQLIGVDKSSLSRMVERLVQRELINRSEGSDRRSVGLTLTVAGKKLLPQLAKLADENDYTFFKSLNEKQRKDFLTTIQQLLSASGWEPTTHGNNRIK